MTPDPLDLDWRRSSRCSNGTCVEVADDGHAILLRDSKRLDRLPLTFTREEFAAFAASIINGDFDDL